MTLGHSLIVGLTTAGSLFAATVSGIAQEASQVPYGLWLPAAIARDMRSMQMLDENGEPIEIPGLDGETLVVQACVEQGNGVFANRVWHPLSIDTEGVEGGALCEGVREGEAWCEILATDIVRSALAPAGTPRAEGFFALRWDGEAPETMRACTADGCAEMVACLPLIDAWAEDEPAAAAEVARIRTRIEMSIPLIEADGINVRARAREAGARIAVPDGGETEERAAPGKDPQ